MRNPRRVASCRTRCGKPQAPQQKGTAATPKAQQEPTPHPAGGEEEDTAPPSQKERNPTHIYRDHQLKHTRLATVGEREAEDRQTEQKRLHQKRSLGIEAKIPKKEVPKLARKIAKLGKKTPHRQHCARLAEKPAL